MSSNMQYSGTIPSRGMTLNSLRDELHSLNMRLLLAMQFHNEQAQEEIRQQLTSVQAEIDRMSLGKCI